MAEKLDQERIKHLLAEADKKWFAKHSGEFKYQEHLDFIADYLVRKYGQNRARNHN